MLSKNSLPSSRRVRSYLPKIFVMVIMSAARSSAQVSEESFVYCLHNPTEITLMGKVLQNGNLQLGVQNWNGSGHFLGVFAIAIKRDFGWHYQDTDSQISVTGGCSFEIKTQQNHSVQLTVEPTRNCNTYGGYGTQLFSTYFPPSSYSGLVKGELNSRDGFFEDKNDRCKN